MKISTQKEAGFSLQVIHKKTIGKAKIVVYL